MLLELRQVNFRYPVPESPKVLENINLEIRQGEFVALVGPSGSGKSTLVLHLNGLLRPSAGKVLYKGRDIHAKGFDLKSLRREVGLLFQFPEANFFGQTVYEDVSYAPANHGKKGENLDLAVLKALELVGLDPTFKYRSPYALSGGEKRRVALAGILAMEPSVLLLDEPSAGLDPGSRESILCLLRELNQKGLTIIMVSHELDEVAHCASTLVVMQGGTVAAKGPVRQTLYSLDYTVVGLEEPEIISLGKGLKLKDHGLPVTEDEAVSAILSRRR